MSELPTAGLWAELRRQKDARVAVAYAVAGWMFADKPLHVKYLRDIWPHDVRPLPFDA